MDEPRHAYHLWKVLPGRIEKLRQLHEAGHQIGIVTNQAGVAFGYVSESDVATKLRAVVKALHLPLTTPIAVCFAHPDASEEWYRDPREVARRKPSGLMIREIVHHYVQAATAGVLYVGDQSSDAQAAEAAHVKFVPANVFFKSAERIHN